MSKGRCDGQGMMPQCTGCLRTLPVSEFARKNPDARPKGRTYTTRCKSCVNEQAKLSIRLQRFNAFIHELQKWPEEKLITEIDYLTVKVKALRDELWRRARQEGT
jgi:hypothetical protein